MYKPKLLSALILVFIVSGLLSSCRRDPNIYYLDRLNIKGNHTLTKNEIVEGLETQEDDLIPWADDMVFDEVTFDKDLQRLATFYKIKGFFDVEIGEHETIPLQHNRLRINLQLTEGPPYTVRKVTYGPLKLLESMEGAVDDLEFMKGERFELEDYKSAKERYLWGYKTLGFCQAEVTGRAIVDRANKEVDIGIIVAPGEFCFLDKVIIKGNQLIPTKKILRRVELAKNDIITPELLNQAEEDAFTISLFNVVIVTPQIKENNGESEEAVEDVPVTDSEPETNSKPENKDTDKNSSVVVIPDWEHRLKNHSREDGVDVDVAIFTQEKLPRAVRLGLGVSIDPASQRGQFKAGWEHLNFIGGNRELDIELEISYAFMPNFYDTIVSGPAGELEVKFVQPEVFDIKSDLIIKLAYELGFSEGFQFHAPSGKISLERKIFSKLRGNLEYKASFYDFFNVRQEIKSSEDNPLGDDFMDPFLLTALTQTLEWDGRDNPVSTRKGLYGRLGFSQSLKPLGSNLQFMELKFDGRVFISPFKWLTLAGRVVTGFQWKFGKTGAVPLTTRFVSGGSNSMRGFEYHRLSPYVENCNDLGENCKKTPVGGLSKFESSIESRFRFTEEFSTALFLDVANVTEDEFFLEFKGMNYAAGFGLRYDTIVGPIRLDFGFRLNEPEKFAHLPNWVFFLSLGEAF